MGAIPTDTKTLNTLFTTSAENASSEMAIAMLTSRPLLDRLYRAGNTKRVQGGARIDIPLRYGMNPGTQWYQGADDLDMTPFETNTTAKYDWKNLHAPVTYTGEEKRKNAGATQMIDLVTEKIEATRLTMEKVLDAAIAGDGTANDGKVILGLDAMFPTTPTADPAIGAVGGITAVANAYWQNYAVTGFGSFAANGPHGSSSDLWINTWDAISDGSDSANFIASAQDVYEFYHRANLSAVQIVMKPNATGMLSFPSLSYMGVDWFWTRNIVSGRAFMLRTDDLQFWIDTQGEFQLSPFQRAWSQDLYGASMLLVCAFVTRRRLLGAVLDGITA
jgi:hypothetical protein